ncbi:MAG TPA: TlyA family RNA methyltransferase, partial [Candidatus Binataceae bacterium]|nr:TlyA family RNA methyltransferase [Candidatus Binataceae bacterium]
MRSRLDVEMTRRGLAESREGAQRLIMAGRVRVNSRPAAKPDLKVAAEASIDIVGGGFEYVSRGGLKLAAALSHFAIDITGKLALDVGASTGGFTDVLLRAGAARVIALDVGYGQLAEALRRDPRVCVIDRMNVRYLEPDSLPYRPELITIDVSFISLKLVLPILIRLAAAPATIIALIKPQFEVGKGMVGKGGIVRDPETRATAVQGVLDFACSLKLTSAGLIEAPIKGAASNQEYLTLLRWQG